MNQQVENELGGYQHGYCHLCNAEIKPGEIHNCDCSIQATEPNTMSSVGGKK